MILKALTLRWREFVLELVGIAGVAGSFFAAVHAGPLFAPLFGRGATADLFVVFGGLATAGAGCVLSVLLNGVLRRHVLGKDLRRVTYEHDMFTGLAIPCAYLVLCWMVAALLFGATRIEQSNRIALLVLGAGGLSFLRTTIAGMFDVRKLRKLSKHHEQ